MANANVNKWAAKMDKWSNIVLHDDQYNPYAHVLKSRSPSFNYLFGRTHGLPEGFTMILWGPPKAGKSILCNDMIGQLHQSDEEAFAIKYDTEFRERLQNQNQLASTNSLFGIDPVRLKTMEVNTPDGIFDHIEKDVAAMCDEGCKIKLIIIDSINQIQGLRGMNQGSVTNLSVGDLAATLQSGFKRILPVQRKHKFAVVLTSQARAEMDSVEVMRGNKVKMGAAFATQHYSEFFCYVTRLQNKDSKVDAFGNSMIDESRKDMNETAQLTGHKIRCVMKGNSADGAAVGRTAEFTFDYTNGITNVYEEIANLAINQSVIERPNNVSYKFGDKTFRGYEAFMIAVRDDKELSDQLLAKIKDLDAK